MLNTVERLDTIREILKNPSDSYADSFFDDILRIIENLELNILNMPILVELKTESECRLWIQELTSRIVLHEHEDGVDNIIFDYLFCG